MVVINLNANLVHTGFHGLASGGDSGVKGSLRWRRNLLLQGGALLHQGAPHPQYERHQLPADDEEAVVAYRGVIYRPRDASATEGAAAAIRY